jgi:hypothetical protein
MHALYKYSIVLVQGRHIVIISEQKNLMHTIDSEFIQPSHFSFFLLIDLCSCSAIDSRQTELDSNIDGSLL